ncbi:hypothetical protein [Micromonospora olivasterospora]|nr:hypothetical protein [Micromonospora olivasterospora]
MLADRGGAASGGRDVKGVDQRGEGAGVQWLAGTAAGKEPA